MKKLKSFKFSTDKNYTEKNILKDDTELHQTKLVIIITTIFFTLSFILILIKKEGSLNNILVNLNKYF